mmetsp:Transcript_23996/g.27381  ORF Transcript_23996/g.27381 Transcript_23996/m.27381 type:complete len:90 (+) Transcript_23996:263-532(+)
MSSQLPKMEHNVASKLSQENNPTKLIENSVSLIQDSGSACATWRVSPNKRDDMTRSGVTTILVPFKGDASFILLLSVQCFYETRNKMSK